MSVDKTVTNIEWNGIPISVSFITGWPINDFCHLEIQADERLPITETGYKSHFMDLAHLKGYCDHIQYVLSWLDDAATSYEWQAYLNATQQLSLFDH